MSRSEERRLKAQKEAAEKAGTTPRNLDDELETKGEKGDDRVAKLENTVSEMMDMMKRVLEGQKKPEVEMNLVKSAGPADEEVDRSPVPPRWRKLVDDILGKDFGLNVVYPESGSGFMLKIVVPLEKSNAAADHLEFYKTDIRTKAIKYSDGIDGVKKYLELIKKNLAKQR